MRQILISFLSWGFFYAHMPIEMFDQMLLLQYEVECAEDVLRVMSIGHSNRAVAETKMNERSSRSHSVLTVIVNGVSRLDGGRFHGCLHLIDLAGKSCAYTYLFLLFLWFDILHVTKHCWCTDAKHLDVGHLRGSSKRDVAMLYNILSYSIDNDASPLFHSNLQHVWKMLIRESTARTTIFSTYRKRFNYRSRRQNLPSCRTEHAMRKVVFIFWDLQTDSTSQSSTTAKKDFLQHTSFVPGYQPRSKHRDLKVEDKCTL